MSRDFAHIRLRKDGSAPEPRYVEAEVSPAMQARATAHEAGNYARWLDYVNGLLTKAGFPMAGIDEERARA